MKTTFACPDCGATGSADASLAGRQVRCRHCNHRFAVPGPAGAEPGGYTLDAPTPATNPVQAMSPTGGGGAVFVPSRGDEPVALSPRRPRRTDSGRAKKRRSRDEESGFAWRTWLLRVAAFAAVALAGIALFAPPEGW
jgi:hypothetical protein